VWSHFVLVITWLLTNINTTEWKRGKGSVSIAVRRTKKTPLNTHTHPSPLSLYSTVKWKQYTLISSYGSRKTEITSLGFLSTQTCTPSSCHTPFVNFYVFISLSIYIIIYYHSRPIYIYPLKIYISLHSFTITSTIYMLCWFERLKLPAWSGNQLTTLYIIFSFI
jgi:hypothetical protein